MSPTLRQQRLRLPWLLALPFLYLVQPSRPSLLAGAILALPGLALRSWASGYIDKDRALAVYGPYAHIRHPLYVGSFLAGSGLVVAGGVWGLYPVFLLLFLWLHIRSAESEEAELTDRFGEAFRAYRVRVPALVPRVRGGEEDPGGNRGEAVPGFGGPAPGADAFQPALFRRNRGWDGPLGVVVGFFLLWAKMVLLS